MGFFKKLKKSKRIYIKNKIILPILHARGNYINNAYDPSKYVFKTHLLKEYTEKCTNHKHTTQMNHLRVKQTIISSCQFLLPPSSAEITSDLTCSTVQ